VDANAIVIDPQVPADIACQLAEAPARRLAPFGAPAPAVVPPPRRRRKRVFTPEGGRAIGALAATMVFFAMTVISCVIALSVTDTQREAAVTTGLIMAVGCLNRFVASGRAAEAASRSGWRRRPLTVNPYHPEWDGLHAVTAYHRRYVAPGQDMDAEARATWQRAADAASKLEESEVVRLGLVDSVQVTAVLPYHLWEVAERLARLSSLRAEHQAILRGVEANDPDVATLLAPQRRAHELANADIERRVRRLEGFADLVGQADTARRRERAVRQLVTLNDSHQELLARIGESADDDELAERMSVDVQAIIDQADEAVRQANEAGRGLVPPGGTALQALDEPG
jgi:hypothetical protein